MEAPNLAVYSDGLVLYHVWERKYYGSQIGGELHLGQMTPEELDDFLNRFEDAGVFSVQGPSDAEGDAPFYFIFAKFGGNNVSLVLNLMTLSMPEAQEQKQIAEFTREFLDFGEWAIGRLGFQEIGIYRAPSIRLNVQSAFAPAPDGWPLPEMPLQDGMVLSGDRAEAIRQLIPLGWFRHYHHDGEDYVIGYTPQLPHGWP